MSSIYNHFLQATESNLLLLSLLNFCIDLSSAFCLAAYFWSQENVFDFFLNRCIFVRLVKSSVTPNTMREPPKIQVILLAPAKSQWDSFTFLVAGLYEPIQLMTREGVQWCFPITQASQGACVGSDFYNNVAFCAFIPRLIPVSFLTSCIFQCPRHRCYSVQEAWFCGWL